ncbi:MAG: alanine racemase C-terminal domain-containing protein [Micrococcales bacterium]
MNTRAQVGKLRRELRFSKSAIEKNLQALGKSISEMKPLVDAFMNSEGLLGLYGSELLILEKALGIDFGIPAIELVGELVSVKKVPAATSISYGYLSTTERVTNLGLVAIGFSDGIPRSATNKVRVSIAGKNYQTVGRIAMDQLVVDLGEDSPPTGIEVTFFTADFPLEEWAKVSDFTQLEILGRITSRVDRVWSK